MKKILSSLLAFVLALMFILSCSKSTPEEPEAPTATGTCTPVFSATVTDTVTITCTSTITPTYTATPPDLYLDNFEDGNNANILSSWTANTYSGSVLHSWGVVGTSPKDGSYAIEVTGTANATINSGTYYGVVSLYSGSTSGVTPVDLTAYNYIKFKMKFAGKVPGTSHPRLFINMTDNTNGLSYEWGAAFDPVYQEYSIPLSSFSVGGGTLMGTLSSIVQVYFDVYIWGAQNDSMDFELVLDEIRFTHN